MKHKLMLCVVAALGCLVLAGCKQTAEGMPADRGTDKPPSEGGKADPSAISTTPPPEAASKSVNMGGQSGSNKGD